MIEMTENALLDALAAIGAPRAPPHALTATELRAKLGIRRTALKERLRRLYAEGRLEVWQATRIDVSGRVQGVPAYTIKPTAPTSAPTSGKSGKSSRLAKPRRG